MKVKCLHGFFIFEETQAGQVSDYLSLTGFPLVPWRSCFTFDTLATLKDYALQGVLYGDLPAVKTYEGEPWEIFEANNFVFNFALGLIVPIATITLSVKIELAGNYYISSGLILPGSVVSNGKRVKNYSGFYSRDTQRWVYSEVDYV